MHRPDLPPLPRPDTASNAPSAASNSNLAPGSVCLVGAGPGDPDLLTLRAVQRLGEADVVLYDHLLDPQILRLAPPQASRICVGKRASRHTLPQADINQLLIDFARSGQRVVRLKGGDPLLFGRGGEEMLALAEAGIPCEVVPGISAALGAAAALGLPLTDRDHAQGCTLVTGHRRQGESTLDWTRHSQPDQTLVVYMGLGEAGHIASQLLANGRDPATPVAIVEKACSSAQRCVCGQLEQLPQLIADAAIATPALLVIGKVVSLHRQLLALRQQAMIS